jgi:hypothetical protein
MKTESKNLGGRPPLPEGERRVQRSIRLKPHHWAKIDAGKERFEALLDDWTPKPAKKKPAEAG